MNDVLRQKVHLADIRFDDRTFKTGFRSVDDELLKSISRIGLLFDPVLLRRNDGYTIVSGFNRLEVLRSLGHSEIPAIIWSEFNADDYEIELLRSLHMRTIGPIGRIHALKLFSDLVGDNAERKRLFREKIGIPEDVSLKIRKLSAYNNIQTFIDRKDSNYRMIVSLSILDDEFLGFIDKCLSCHDFRFSVFREIVDIYGDIVRNDTMRTLAFEMMSNTDISESDEMILRKFREVRFPLSESYNNTIKEKVTLFKSHGISLCFPENSEGKEAVVSIVCKRKDGGKGFADAVDFLKTVDPDSIIRYL